MLTSDMSRFIEVILIVLVVVSSVHGHVVRVRANDTVFDWRQKGVIAPVSNQGQIGDAVAFVVAEGVESLHAIQNDNRLVSLSRQEVADCCDDNFHPKYTGYQCIALIGGLCTAEAYKSAGGQCNNKTCPAVGKVTGTGHIPTQREDLMVEVIHRTPLSSALDASLQSFQIYASGIYSDPSCSSTSLDHVVQIVGYGTTSEGQDYWILKNSWGEAWGERGYMRIVRGKNMCGIASEVFYPINDQ